MAEAMEGKLEGVNSGRLFVGSCMSLVSTSVAFGVLTSFMGDLKEVFALTNEQAGWIGGAAIWGFTISIFVFGPLVDVLGMRLLMRFAMVCHLAGPLIMIFAGGFTGLFTGALIISLANGTVEAVCNPLVATIYPDRKTQKLNQFHVWFPGGIVIGGLLAFVIDQIDPGSLPMGIDPWQFKLALILVPTVLYGILFTAQKFPVTERVRSGVSFGGMVRATFLRPLFIILFICMALTASLELGPGRWMGEVMNSAMKATFSVEDAGILVLVYGSTLMAVLRFFAGPVVHRLSPTGLLVVSAILAGAGLFALTHAGETAAMVIGAATVFYLGVCYFWPTMLGVAAERVPKGGSLALALLGGWGMAVVGLITVPVMGMITDGYGHDKLPMAETRLVIQEGAAALPVLKAGAGEEGAEALNEAIALVTLVNKEIGETNVLPPVDTGKALRAIATHAKNTPLGPKADALLKPADDHGGLMSFRWVSAAAIVLVLVFGILFLMDRAKGGYKIEKI